MRACNGTSINLTLHKALFQLACKSAAARAPHMLQSPSPPLPQILTVVALMLTDYFSSGAPDPLG